MESKKKNHTKIWWTLGYHDADGSISYKGAFQLYANIHDIFYVSLLKNYVLNHIHVLNFNVVYMKET